MTFLIRFFRAWYEFTIVTKVPFWPKFIGIVSKYRPVVIALPYIGYVRRAFWNEHALVLVVFSRCMN